VFYQRLDGMTPDKQTNTNYGPEPVRGDARLMLLLTALAMVGLPAWWGLFLAVERSVSTLWSLTVTPPAGASSPPLLTHSGSPHAAGPLPPP
jgi:hypothetical protein